MNTALLLREFGRVGDSPEAIPRLRSFIMELAVRGRLSDQCVDEKPALESLAVAHPERRVEPVSGPFDLPVSWDWVRFGDMAAFSAGRTPSRNDPSFWNPGDYPWTSIADMLDGDALRERRNR